MSGAELLRTYPKCVIAVAYVELMLCEPCEPGEPSSWQLLMSATPPMSIEEVIATIHQLLIDEVSDDAPFKAAEALSQIDEPSFRVYIGGRMGMM